MTIRRTFAIVAPLFALAFVLAGCGKKTADNGTGSATSDSMLATTPVEQPQGQLQSQQQPAPSGAEQQAAPTPQTKGEAVAENPEHAGKAKPARKPASQAKPKSPAASGSLWGTSTSTSAPAEGPSATVAAGTALGITMGGALSSETAAEGTAWTGTLKEALTVGANVVFPAGSTVQGIVAGAKPAAKGDRAFLVLRVTNIAANGFSRDISATADSMIAGSTRKRNVGAVMGGAAAGALLGKAFGGSGKSALIGGLLGGAAASGVVASSKGFQVEVPAGQAIVFHVDRDTRLKL